MQNTVLVQEPDELIRLDLAQTITDAWPDATVILCRSPDEAFVWLGADRVPEVAILRVSLRAAQASGLMARAIRCGARVLLTAADEDEAPLIAAVGWRAIDMPFTTEQLRDALRDLTASGDDVDSRCKVAALG